MEVFIIVRNLGCIFLDFDKVLSIVCICMWVEFVGVKFY